MFNAAKKAIVVIAATATSAHGVTDLQEKKLKELANAIDANGPSRDKTAQTISDLAGHLQDDPDVRSNEGAKKLLRELVKTYRKGDLDAARVAAQTQLSKIRNILGQPSSGTNRNRTAPATLPTIPTSNTVAELAERKRVQEYAQRLRDLPDTGRVSDTNAYLDITGPAASANLFPGYRYLLTAARDNAKRGKNATAAAHLEEYVRSTGPAF